MHVRSFLVFYCLPVHALPHPDQFLVRMRKHTQSLKECVRGEVVGEGCANLVMARAVGDRHGREGVRGEGGAERELGEEGETERGRGWLQRLREGWFVCGEPGHPSEWGQPACMPESDVGGTCAARLRTYKPAPAPA